MSTFRPVRTIVRKAIALCQEKGYELGDKLGEGNFGVVYAATHAKYGKVAIKIGSPDEDLIEYTRREVEIQKSFDHPNIVNIFDSYEENDFVVIVMELCESSLTKFSKSFDERIPEDQVKLVFYDIFSLFYP